MNMLTITPQLLIFDTFTSIIIIVSCLTVFAKTKSLYQMCLHKGLKYFSQANLYYAVFFIANYIYYLLIAFNPGISLNVIKVIISIVAMYSAFMGGVYISYALVWRRFERDRIQINNKLRIIILHLSAVFFAIINVLLMDIYNFHSPVLFYIVMLFIISSAIIYNLKFSKVSKDIDPFISYVVLALGIYMLFFIESLLMDYLPIIHYYVFGIIAVFFKAVSHNVSRLARGVL
jgi:hypothetical protein